MDRGNRYEAAFEEYLRDQALPYIGVDEARRAMLGDGSVKSLDFIVYGLKGCRLLVDIKGRVFPAGSPSKPRRVWECWATREDVAGLTRWAEIFGAGYESAFVFMYRLGASATLAADTPDLWSWRGNRYLMRAVLVEDYVRYMRPRSPKWGTVSLAVADFRQIVRPLSEYTHLREFRTNRRSVHARMR